MRAWRINRGASSVDDLIMIEHERPTPGPGEVLIRIRACSLNYRDQMILRGRAPSPTLDSAITPLSDGAGEVEAIGPGISRIRVGDRVAGLFFQNWRDGPPNGRPGLALGGPPAKGMLAEYVILPESGVIPIARSLSFEEAATLPCSGVTAWNAVMGGHRTIGPGRTVLTMGTGGVSLMALQLAKAAGARVVATSSSDEKLVRVRELGADITLNYRSTPEWGSEIARLLKGGADHIVELGGGGTLSQSINAVAPAGEIALVGVLDHEGAANPLRLMFKSANLRGIAVGSAAMADALSRAIDACGIRPVIDRIFPFEDAREAYTYQMSSALFGKVVIRV